MQNEMENSMETTSDIQIQSDDSKLKTIVLGARLENATNMENKNQLIYADDYAPKVRKQYTISKQRERWTAEEHNKFLEALKLYGRAWRHIEEHIGTKTAVQIRSHAQKFFCKVARESNGNEEKIVKPIEIPPPRPKRKPRHPYPRKMADQVKTGAHISDGHVRSVSPSLSDSGHEKQSPTCVFSAMGSDETCVTDSNIPKCNFSPASCGPGDQPGGLFPSDTPEENGSENGSNSPSQGNDSSSEDENVPMELFPQDTAFHKEGSSEQLFTLKLFGTTVIARSNSTNNHCDSLVLELNDNRHSQTVAQNMSPQMISASTDAQCARTGLSYRVPTIYYMQFLNESSNDMEHKSDTPVPYWAYYGGVSSYPFFQLHNSVSEMEQVYFDGNNVPDREIQSDGYRILSNSRSANVELDGNKPWEIETQSCSRIDLALGERKTISTKPNIDLDLVLGEQKTSAMSANNKKGLVPYKRSLVERDNISTITGEEGEEQRIRLCL